MNVLLISQAYPPGPFVGALRARKLALALRAQGHAVYVVTERLPGETEAVRLREPGLEVHTVTVGLRYRLRLVALRNRWRRNGTGGPEHAAADEDFQVAAGATRPGFFRRLVLSLLWLPDDEQRFILPALRAARRLQPHDIDLVYSSAPSFSSHLVALVLHRAWRVRWVAEFRDPWTDQERESHRMGVAAIERLHRWLEHRCLLDAHRVVVVTEGLRRRFQDRLQASDRSKVLLALNGIDELAPPDRPRVPGPFRIVHAGTFYHNRDPRPFLAGLAALRRDLGLTPADVRVDFVGNCRTYDAVSVEAEVAGHGLQDVVHFHDWMPHEGAQAMLREADLVYLIALGQPLQVPNKLFDYLGTRRPVLAVVDAGGESEQMLTTVGGHHVVSVPAGGAVSVDAMTRALREAYERHAAGAAAPAAAAAEAQLQAWLSRHQLGNLVESIAT